MQYTFAFGYKTREAAEAALEDCFATGEILPGEKPIIKSYSVDHYGRMNGFRDAIRWCIKVEG